MYNAIGETFLALNLFLSKLVQWSGYMLLCNPLSCMGFFFQILSAGLQFRGKIRERERVDSLPDSPAAVD